MSSSSSAHSVPRTATERFYFEGHASRPLYGFMTDSQLLVQARVLLDLRSKLIERQTAGTAGTPLGEDLSGKLLVLLYPEGKKTTREEGVKEEEIRSHEHLMVDDVLVHRFNTLSAKIQVALKRRAVQLGWRPPEMAAVPVQKTYVQLVVDDLLRADASAAAPSRGAEMNRKSNIVDPPEGEVSQHEMREFERRISNTEAYEYLAQAYRDNHLVSEAILSKDFEEAKRLIEAGRFDILGKVDGDRFNRSLLDYIGGNSDAFVLIPSLLKRKGVLALRGKYGDTLLHMVSRTHPVLDCSEEKRRIFAEAITALIENGADLNARNEVGKTPFHFVCGSDVSPDLLELCIRKGAEVSLKDNKGITPLWQSPFPKNRSDVLKLELLLNNGADVSVRYGGEWTILHKVVSFCINEFGRYAVALLLEKGADPNAREEKGRTPLYLTTMGEIAQLLVSRGAVLETRDAEGKTPLLHVAFLDRSEVSEVLLQNGANIEQRDEIGRTPLHFAAQALTFDSQPLRSIESGEPRRGYGWNETGTKLLERGAVVDARDEMGCTPLHYARNKKIIEELIRRGADVHARDRYGRTPLHLACERGFSDIVECLLAYRADPNACDLRGNTPLHVMRSSSEIEHLLTLWGADPSIRNLEGKTASDLGVPPPRSRSILAELYTRAPSAAYYREVPSGSESSARAGTKRERSGEEEGSSKSNRKEE